MRTTSPTINATRLVERLDRLATIGRDPRGGMSRFSYTPSHTEACLLVAGWMREAGLEPFLDRVGNLAGVGNSAGPALAAGSHLDTVPMGGRLDGALGVVAAVECAQALREAGAPLRHPMAALAFADEEGNSFGIGCLTSRALIGELPEERTHEIHDRDGVRMAQRIAGWSCPLPHREPPRLAAYIELHIEQGPRLEAEGLDAAAASAIAGISRTTITFRGRANHAGTTPMSMRRDALWGAGALVLEVRRLALASAGQAVATVGRIEAEPGSTNVIPGIARVRVEIRSGEESRLTELREAVEAAARRFAGEFGLSAIVDPWDHMGAEPLDERISALALEAATARGLRAISMPSWAGHDAKILAPHVPSGLLFVPSKGGISHAPDEDTDPAHLAAGAQLLLDVLLKVDAHFA
ncbi:MAG: Zn-dependent hydrolase [bacterium]